MEDLKALVVGVFGGLIVIGLSKLLRAYRKRSLRDDIEFAEYEKNHLAEMKKSSVEMNRSSFRALFAVLMLMALANLLPRALDLIGLGAMSKMGDLMALFLWAMVVGLAAKFWRRYDKLKNYKEATAKLDEKLELLKAKYENS